MSHWTWLRFRLLAIVLRTVVFQRFPITSLELGIPGQLPVNEVYTRTDSSPKQYIAGLNPPQCSLTGRRHLQYFHGDKQTRLSGVLQGWELGGAHRSPPASPEPAPKDVIQYSCAHALLWPSWIWPKIMNSKKVSLMAFTLLRVHLCCMLCMPLVSVATWLFLLQTTVSQYFFFFFNSCFALQHWLKYCYCNQVFWLTAE